ncbi:DUF2806 domain-containing protein [Agrobacterium leguminum]|uniref:DUF2806 domain-containing protein n=1 Tax=Agrobacterium leguminum TaxID=2792015 RepID=A0A9X3KKG6_9HYPH|nr:DUF2806 domain-containing protein [Agrobacterium leguminum]MCZ7912287.1 DUF2806 domain-containing protein [Agrobacterium leguminum]
MSDDHLDKETSVSVELTPNGIRASAKSRTVAAIDRLIGSVADRWSVPFENKAAEERAKSKARVEIIEAAKALGIQRIKDDPEFATRAIENHFETTFRRHENKEAVVREALEDLDRLPPTEMQSSTGPEVLDEKFLVRFERYSEDASTADLRVKWGKVLAAEIRKPNSVSAKVMRIVDELEGRTAELFEGLCHNRIGDGIIKCLSGNLSFAVKLDLVSAGLIVDPGSVGQVKLFGDATSNSGEKIWILTLNNRVLAVSSKARIPPATTNDVSPLVEAGGGLGVPAYILTSAGSAVAQILEDKQDLAVETYFRIIERFLAGTGASEYRQEADGSFTFIRRLTN